MATINQHTTRAAGTILTAAIYNADHVNHVSNAQNLNNDKLEGATPPVVDGHAVLWQGTSGAAMKTAGYVPANEARTLQATAPLTIDDVSTPLNLSANRTFKLTTASQAEAEGGSNNVAPLTALRVRQWFDHANAKASQAEAEGVTVDTKWMSPLRWRQAFDHSGQKASQAEAQAGTNNTKWMSPLRVAEAITALAPLEVKAFAKGGSGSGADLQTRCSVSGTISKTVTLSPAAPHANYAITFHAQTDAGEFANADNPFISNITASGFTFPASTGGRWSFAVFW